ncbi:MAG: bifunctional proline dehydrogenase/L-glutamate gamma-semialdehyde dehydrogenase, partial [Pseudomonadota bacterium]
VYINRNQIGAVVGSQPFGGHGLSGTGPKAGGPLYLHAFAQDNGIPPTPQAWHLPGPTGDENSYSVHPRHGIFCAGPGAELAREQAALARDLGCTGIIEAPDATPMDIPEEVSAVIRWGDTGRDWALACAERAGPIIPLVTSKELHRSLTLEKTVCIDTTASGGNAELLAASSKVDLAAE